MPYGDLIIWIEQNQKKLYPRVPFDPSLYNITNPGNGKKMLKFDQTKFMVYGLEVGHCQYGIYDRLTHNPSLIEKRKCGNDPDLTPLRFREEGKELPAQRKSSKQTTNNNAACLLEF
jgi:hypothetical protein